MFYAVMLALASLTWGLDGFDTVSTILASMSGLCFWRAVTRRK
jgi:hypothetical protein